MRQTSLQGPDTGRGREWLAAGILLVFFVFSWRSVGITRFNALDSPFFLAPNFFVIFPPLPLPASPSASLGSLSPSPFPHIETSPTTLSLTTYSLLPTPY